MKKSTAGTKERSPDSLSVPNQNTILINIKWYYFTRYGKKYKEIQLTKNKINLNIRKNDKSSTLPRNNQESEKSRSLSVWLYEKWISCTSVFSNTCAWEQTA